MIARQREGDDLVIRRSDGGVQRCFGYFTPAQVAARKAWGEAVTAALRQHQAVLYERERRKQP